MPGSTRVSLSTGGTFVVEIDRDVLARRLEAGEIVAVQPVRFEGEPEPEPLALRIEHVGMLADASPDAGGPSAPQLESGEPYL
jgi:hypothetical protein